MSRAKLVLASICASLVALSAYARPPSAAGTIEELRRHFVVARALVPGSRPAPPDTDLSVLHGYSRSEIRKSLGEPQDCEFDPTEVQPSITIWCYQYGPPPEPIKQEGDVLTVTTGGPWLLVFEFTGDSVVSARWLGQR